MTTSDSDPDRRTTENTPGGSDNGNIKQKAKEEVQNVKSQANTMAREKAEMGQHQIKEVADSLSDAIDAAASSLDEQDREGLARYARKLSSDIAHAAGQLEDRSVDDLAKDAKRLARTNPALFMLGSIAVGFGLSRFFKASTDQHNDDTEADTEHYANRYQSDGAMQRPGHQTYQEQIGTSTGTSSVPRNDGRDHL